MENDKREICSPSGPVVSVIVPCYNYGRFLRETLESLLAQTYVFWECLIIDDGSIDATSQVAQEFLRSDERFKYLYQTNQGLSAARNRGLARAMGRYIQFLDADDKLQSQKFEKQVAFLESNPEVDIAYGSVVYFGESGDILNSSDISRNGADWMPRVSGSADEMVNALVKGNAMVVNAPMLRISVIVGVGYFNTSLRGHEDWEYWIRCAIDGRRFRYWDEEGAHAMVRVHRNSMTQDQFQMLMSNIEVRNWMRGVLQDPILSIENEYQAGLFLLKIAKIQIIRGEFRQAVRSAQLAIWRARFRPDVVAGTLCLLLPDNVVQRLKGISRKLRFFS